MNNEVAVRLGFFFGIFIIVAIWEVLSPRRVLKTSKPIRWISNIGVVFIDAVSVRYLLPLLPIGLAVLAEEKGWGVLNALELPEGLSIVLGILVLDLIVYLQHVMFHAVPILWRLHMMHHADLDYDVTTALRFHPIEIMISMAIKLSVVATIGPSAWTVVIFEVILNGTAMFNHGNIRLPLNVDRILRMLVVTPDMHRVHHSVIIRETNSNFGFNFPWWDRMFGTYRPQPAAGHEGMTIGLSQFRNAARLTLPWMIALPFIGNPGEYSINRSGSEPHLKKK
jgi:sterol desaturase/sphingolipid hydroxylase (fatty acid hydroxylase superfamily)